MMRRDDRSDHERWRDEFELAGENPIAWQLQLDEIKTRFVAFLAPKEPEIFSLVRFASCPTAKITRAGASSLPI